MVISCPWVTLITAVSLVYLVKIRRINLHITRDTYRLKAVLMSPINSLVQDTLNGLTTIRAFGRGDYFLSKVFELCDIQTEAFITSNAINRWCAFRIDMQAYLITSIYAFFALFVSQPDSPSKLAISAVGFQLVVEIARHLNTAVRWTATLENNMVSIQRLLSYVHLKPESARQKHQVTHPEAQNIGDIEFQDVEMSYSKQLRPALSNLSFKLHQGDKVAVVGRTGSGKSSMFQVLQAFRYPKKGQVLINEQDLTTLDTNWLRHNTTVVLQNPFIVSTDTIRSNLDPMGIHTTQDLNNALAKAMLGNLPLDGSTSALSTGQIQLMSLAQAFLQPKAQLVLLDEPTSQIDYQTQRQVLLNLFKHFKQATVLMIAHRLETAVKFSSKVMVLDKGEIVEFDNAYKLLVKNIEDTGITNPEGHFGQMVLALNEQQHERILKKAKNNYLN